MAYLATFLLGMAVGLGSARTGDGLDLPWFIAATAVSKSVALGRLAAGGGAGRGWRSHAWCPAVPATGSTLACHVCAISVAAAAFAQRAGRKIVAAMTPLGTGCSRHYNQWAGRL